ncbi:IS110 family transposase [Streptomyces sp. NPDC004728]|uniref:IS110 family transposase n=1 Tax=Streptomyces sp. NPDC004728 TaxID=3154289 RepID=UPI0033AF510B
MRTAQRNSPHRRPGPAATGRGCGPHRGPHRAEEPCQTRRRTRHRTRDPHQSTGQRVTAHDPGLRAAHGVGPDTAAQLLVTAGGNPDRMRTEASFAALCGAAPVPASSGRTNRHRLSRGGDRGANAALYRIALVRMSSDSRTREYAARQTAAGRTKKEVIRLLKRAIAREMFRCLTTTVTIPGTAGLRPMQQAKNITLTAVAQHFGVWPTVISRLERELSRDDDLTHAYRDCLQAA